MALQLEAVLAGIYSPLNLRPTLQKKAIAQIIIFLEIVLFSGKQRKQASVNISYVLTHLTQKKKRFFNLFLH